MMRSTRFIGLLVAISLIALFTKNETFAQGNILTVTNTLSNTTTGGCDSDCSLLDAIYASELTSDVETIQFNISGTPPFTILTPDNNGYQIHQSVVIDATTQPGYIDKPLIQIRPSSISTSAGIDVEKAGTNPYALAVTIRGLAINSITHGDGIVLGYGQNLIEQNFIGVNTAGTLGQPNDIGIYTRSANNVIRNNVISGNNIVGIYLISSSGTNNQVVGNFIGTNFDGSLPIPNKDGIDVLEGANSNIIGGITPADRNIISSNTGWGIYILGSDDYPTLNTHNTTVQGNYIGTDSLGTHDLGNGAGGIEIYRSDSNIIGGTSGTTPGGDCTGACNLISGNSVGIYILVDAGGTSEENQIQGNFIGTTFTGQVALPNDSVGIAIYSSSNTVGGTTPAARNLISGNTTHGIQLSGLGTFGNKIWGNYIGTDTTGFSELGNHAYGIYINQFAYGNQIGDGTDEGANWIGFNGKAGVGIDNAVDSNGFYADQNLITANSIFYNTGLGIDLLPTGITANDVGDNDAGGNGLQNAPVISSVVSRDNTTISGTLNSAPNRDYIIEFFASSACDGLGYGEGEVFLGSASATTNGSGNVTFQGNITPPADGEAVITATAIDNDATLDSPFVWNTSEFSACKAAQTDLSITNMDSVDPVLPGDSLSYTLTVSNSNAATASYADNVIVTDTLPVGLIYVSATPSQGTCSFDLPTRKVTCHIGQVTMSETITIATTVSPSIATATINNTATVTTDTHDTVLSNNTATQTTGIAHANLGVVITDTPDPVLADSMLTYKVVVSNLGTDTATNVALTDTLPANVYVIGFTTTQGSCTLGTGIINCSLGTLNNGASATVTILMRPDTQMQNTIITNKATVSGLQVDTVPANNLFTATTKVNPSSGMPPLNLFTISTPTLTWNSISWAAAYEIQVDNDSGFNSPNFDMNNIPQGTFTVTTSALADGIWYWHVRAKRDDGTWGGWSATASFMIDTP
ncbi:MAG: DUF11 domain-containing protein [Anaerolineae bacterium]|nr:DUF11 domain-containing protein [Anaerolineae bacterium]